MKPQLRLIVIQGFQWGIVSHHRKKIKMSPAAYRGRGHLNLVINCIPFFVSHGPDIPCPVH